MTAAVPAFAMSAAVTAAVSRVLLTKVVVRAVPFHLTVELPIKFVPLSVSVNAVPPAVAELGEMPDKAGTGLDEPPPITCPTVFTATAFELTWPCSQVRKALKMLVVTEYSCCLQVVSESAQTKCICRTVHPAPLGTFSASVTNLSRSASVVVFVTAAGVRIQ